MLTNDLTNVRIIQKRLEAEDVVSLRLRSLDGRPLPGFEAGAHIDIEVAPGVRRQYSLCSASGDAMEYEIAVLREPASRGGSKAVHDVLQVGQVVSISSPRNHFPLDPAATRSLLFAGGIGVTPIMAMAEELAGKESAFEMHYCARTPAKMAYRDRVGAGIFASHARLHFDDGADVQKLDLAAVLADVDPATHIYVCGPAGFINAVLAAAEAQGWPEENVHREFFAAPADPNAPEADNTAFEIVIGSTGLHFDVPATRTIADVLQENGIFVPTSCSEGICGTCVVSVLEGIPDHRDFVLSEAEHAANDKMTLCCSRARTPSLVIDL